MEYFDVDVSPRELYTRYRNVLQVTIAAGDVSSIKEIQLVCISRIQVHDRPKENYVLSRQSLAVGDVWKTLPVIIEWIVDISRKGPLSFESRVFSILNLARIEIVKTTGKTFLKEIPLTIVPGKIEESEIAAERGE